MDKNTNTVVLPEAKNPLTATEADRMAALIKLDIARYRRERTRFMAQIADIDFMIAESETALADLARRVANVDYPPQPEAGAPAAPDGAETPAAPDGDAK